MSTTKAQKCNAVFKVLWKDDKSEVLNQSSTQSYEISAGPLITHHVDLHGDSSYYTSDRDQTVQITDATSILEEANDHEEHIITEISSTCKKSKIKKKLINGKEISSEKGKSKIKKEKYSLDNLTMRKRFSRNWFQVPEFSRWLEESSIPGYAFCNICKKDLLPGKSELLKHSQTAKHKKKIEALGLGTKDDPTLQRIVDLRSDSVTCPNREMREAMRDATVGDDCFGEDPMVIDLENRVANLTGKEGGLFVLSGTMANLVCILTHCWNRGSLIILGDQSYMFRASQGSISEFGGVSQRSVHNLSNGTFDLSELRNVFKTFTSSWPTTTLVCIENTHTRMGGKALPIEWLDELGVLSSEYGISIHLDGARLVNASAAVGTSLAKLSYHCSSVAFGLDKGLGAPGGCVIAASKDFIERAKIIRNSFGGTIHQAGILAAAAIYGLTNCISRISKDHSNAIALAKGVCDCNSSAVTVDTKSVQTNIVHLICDNVRVNPEQLCERLAQVLQEEAMQCSESVIVKATPIQPNIVRLVTHGNLFMEDIRAAIKKLQYVISEFDNYFVIEYSTI